MINRIFICLSSAFSLVILNEFFYVFNFTGFSFGFIDLTGMYFADLTIAYFAFVLTGFVLSVPLSRMKKRGGHPLTYLIPATVVYLVLCLILNLTGRLIKDGKAFSASISWQFCLPINFSIPYFIGMM